MAAAAEPVVAVAVSAAQSEKELGAAATVTAATAVADADGLRPRPDVETLSHTLQQQFDFPPGLARALAVDVAHNFPLRIWVVDNSGSMQTNDGHRVLSRADDPRSVRIVNCSRWQELKDVVGFHSSVSIALEAPTEFRLLNPPGSGAQQFLHTGHGMPDEQAFVDAAMATSPRGVTPLTHHIQEIREQIVPMADELNEQGQQVMVVLATDGLPSDSQGRSTTGAQRAFTDALKSLTGLPVAIVVRLLTDEDEVVEYWNNIDGEIELPIDVLDDWSGEAKEIHDVNPWLTYGLVLHRAREFGMKNKLLDLIDERRFQVAEVREFMTLIFGWPDIPEPELGWTEFHGYLQGQLARVPMVYCAHKQRPMPWLRMDKLRELAGRGGYCSIS